MKSLIPQKKLFSRNELKKEYIMQIFTKMTLNNINIALSGSSLETMQKHTYI